MTTTRDPRLGVALPTYPDTAVEGVGLARDALNYGYDDVWIEEVARGNAYAIAGALSQAVPGMRIGTAVVPAQTRAPLVHALAGASLSQLTDANAVLGIGVSSENVVGDWAGQPYDRPVLRMREYFEAIKALLGGERVTYEGETLSVQHARLKPGAYEPPPVFMAAMNPQMLRLAGELADGVILNMVPESALAQVLGEVRRGADRNGRDPAEIEVVGKVGVMLTDDPAGARKAMLDYGFGSYIAADGYNRFYSWIGFEAVARAVKAAHDRGDRTGASGAVTEDFIDAISILGSADEIADRFRRYVELGVDSLVVIPLLPDVDTQRDLFGDLAGSLDGFETQATGIQRATS